MVSQIGSLNDPSCSIRDTKTTLAFYIRTALDVHATSTSMLAESMAELAEKLVRMRRNESAQRIGTIIAYFIDSVPEGAPLRTALNVLCNRLAQTPDEPVRSVTLIRDIKDQLIHHRILVRR